MPNHDPTTGRNSSRHHLAQQAFDRAAGASLIQGNTVELLIDAKDNYSAWLDAIRTAKTRILLENYIFANDTVGRTFLAELTERAKAGVLVNVICDWLGCLGQGGRRFWQPLIDAGGQVRYYNPIAFGSPFGWINRDHRKLLVIDRETAFIGGLCISSKWLGDERRGILPWRDTAVAVRGPALAEFVLAFADVWAQLGAPLDELQQRESGAVGDVGLRVIATQPDTAGLFRLDQMIAAMAQRSLWLADAYFVGVSPYVQALIAAARDGVDVRLLVPGASDLPVMRTLSRSGYSPLLEAGVRVFEWNGAMMHAKTAVADSRWARIGSSNLNIASWIGNCELDVSVENDAFAKKMETQYLTDLENSTEIVLAKHRRIRRSSEIPRASRSSGSTSRAAASALRVAHSVGVALGNRRVIGQGEMPLLPWLIASLFAFALISVIWPWLLAAPLALFAAWIGSALLWRYVRLSRTKASNGPPATTGDQANKSI